MTTQATEALSLSNHEIGDALASGWERRRAFIERTTTPVRDWMLRELAPQPGQTLLELAAGPGDTGFDALALTGGDGHLISSDLSPAMVDVARRRAAERGVRGVDFRQLDIERVELDENCVDGVVCRYAYMLVDDPGAAFAETRRVLRPGGRAVLAVWGAPDRNPFFAVLGMTLVRAGHVPPLDMTGPGPFSLADPQRLRGLLEAAGFTDTRAEEVPVTFAVRDVAEYLAIAGDTAGPIALVLRGLSTDERASLAASLEAPFAPFRTAAGYAVPGVTVVAVAA